MPLAPDAIGFLPDPGGQRAGRPVALRVARSGGDRPSTARCFVVLRIWCGAVHKSILNQAFTEVNDRN